MTTTTAPKSTVADVIADRFIKSLENGVAPWQKPWASVRPQNGVSRKPYKGVNAFMLAFFGGDDYFLTYKQAKALGGQVEEGAKGIPVTFWKRMEKKDKSGDYLVCRYYTVFPVSKCGLPDFKRANKVITFSPVELAEVVLAKNTTPVSHGGASAYYTPSKHAIQMPNKESFKSVANYYATLFHEIGHSLGEHSSDSFGGEVYAKEELVAELFASIALQHCGLLESVNFDNSTAYLGSWLKALNDDKTLIQKASTEAFKRWEKLMGKVEEEVEEEVEA
jgi:antirestriction protein ArdC